LKLKTWIKLKLDKNYYEIGPRSLNPMRVLQIAIFLHVLAITGYGKRKKNNTAYIQNIHLSCILKALLLEYDRLKCSRYYKGLLLIHV